MNINKYLNKKRYNGELVNMVFSDLHKEKSFKNVLFVRTPTTGCWMDYMLKNNEINTTRILYKTPNNTCENKLYNIMEHDEVESFIAGINIKFDLICLDSYHEYYYSNKDLIVLTPFLSDEGIILAHDCFPPKKIYTNPTFVPGSWCGVTYICLVEFAYNNPQWYYAVLNNDNGVGIISKKKLDNLEQNFNRTKQENLIKMHNEGNKNIYEYYCENSNELINLIS